MIGPGNPKYGTDFVYGNVFVKENSTNVIHWNGDQYSEIGRAMVPGSMLYVYNNTIFSRADSGNLLLINTHLGGFDCPSGQLKGTVDARNNIFVNQTKKAGAAGATMKLSYCGKERYILGKNWISPGWVANTTQITGIENVISPANNDPGFVNVDRSAELASLNLHLAAGSSAIGVAGLLSAGVTTNPLGLNLTPTEQFNFPVGGIPRKQLLDLGAFSYGDAASPPAAPANLRLVSQ